MSRPVYLGSLTTRVSLPTCTAVATSFPYYGISPGTGEVVIPACYPPGYAIDGVYSPGICPYGWTSACSFTGGQAYVKSALAASETGVQCCPDFFTCSYGVAYCSSNSVIGKPILVLYQSTDSAISRYFAGYGFSVATSTSVSTLLVTATATTTSTSDAAAPTSASTNDASASSGLSTGAKIGIGIGVPLFVILVAAICVIFFLIRRKRKQDSYDGHLPDEFPAVLNTGNGGTSQSQYAMSETRHAVPQTHYTASERPYSRAEFTDPSTPMLAYSNAPQPNQRPA